MPSFKLQTRQINKEGKLAWEYNPLYNLVKTVGGEGGPSLSTFDTEEISFDINHPVDIECQPSYDGSVNLILNDDRDVPRIVNSGFTVLEDNTYARPARNQSKPTNLYKDVSLETMLQRTSDKSKDALKIDLDEVYIGGELKGGNYIFLFKYMDDDENTTKIVAESSVVSIFKNDLISENSVVGTLADEVTTMAVKLKLKNVDRSFSKIQVLYRRTYSDLTGTLQREYCKIATPFKIPDQEDFQEMLLTITGVEPVINITYDDIIKQFNTYKTVKTQAQVQNMLFFGNVSENYDDDAVLQSLSYQIEIIPRLSGSVSEQKLSLYKDTHNLYNNVGYMPGEFYRIGIVYVYDDETLSQAYNLRGCYYTSLEESNINASVKIDDIHYNQILINEGSECYNTRGIFRIPELEYQLSSKNGSVCPVLLHARLSDEVVSKFKELGIRGYFFVRQARIPLFIGQGFSVGISETAHCPLLHREVVAKDPNDDDVIVHEYGVYTPLKRNGDKSLSLHNDHLVWTSPENKKEKDGKVLNTPVKIKGLVCADSYLVPQLQSVLDGSKFRLQPVAKYRLGNIETYGTDNIYTILTEAIEGNLDVEIRGLVQIPAETSFISHESNTFSSKCGSSTDIRSSRSLWGETNNYSVRPTPILDDYMVRGNFGAYIGVCGEELEKDTVYNIYSKEHPGASLSNIQQYIKKLAYNNAEFFAVSDKHYFYDINVEGKTERIITQDISIAGGDCYYCNVGTKFQYNFLDHNAPLNSTIVDSAVIKSYGDNKKLADNFFSNIAADGWLEMNVSDFNAVHFGTVLSYKCISNYNLNVRCIDDQNTDERSLFGDTRSFYPVDSAEKNVSFKLPESKILPLGHSSSLRCFPYYVSEQVPFIKKHFDNRVAFSNVQANDSFANSYRVFTGLSYQDIERTYGAIVKLIPLGSSLFCVFEHGCGIVPINEKALLSTAQGQSIHLYGSQVIQSQVTVVSQDYGTTWEDSIVITPNGIYGVDTWAKKIWRYNNSGFSIISDQLVQRYLNDNITLSESDIYPVVAVKNVKSHYNNYKGDVMFTFYDDNVCWNLCFNERIDKFVTRYSWTPLLSENLQNSFVSIDRTAVELYSTMAKNMESGQGKLYLPSPQLDYSKDGWNIHALTGLTKDVNTAETLVDEGFYSHFDLNISGYADVYSLVQATIKSVQYATWKDDKVVVHTVDNDAGHCFKHAFEERSATLMTKTHDLSETVSIESIGLPTKGDMFCLKWGKDLFDTDKFFDILDEDPDEIGNETDLINIQENNTTDDDSEEFVSDVELISYGQNEDGSEKTNDHGFSLRTSYNNFRMKARNYVAVEKGDKLRLDVKLNDFVCWLKVDLEVSPYMEEDIKVSDSFTYSKYKPLQSFRQTIVLIPKYEHLTNSELHSEESGLDYIKAKEAYDKVNRIGFYIHGRAGIYDEINYTDSDPDNEIKPTFWYNKQEPFEFEFVVNSGAGMQKIFDNLAIISNNAEPESLEFSIIGDAYDFNKAGIFKSGMVEPIEDEFGIIDSYRTGQEKLRVEYAEGKQIKNVENVRYSTEFVDHKNESTATVSLDPVLKQYYIHVNEGCLNVKDKGKMLGNIEYREDKWLVNIAPLKYRDSQIVYQNDEYTKTVSNQAKSTKLRDKWCKVRIKYTGDKLVVISAIQTMFTMSFS